LTSGIHTPSKSGGAAPTRETAHVPIKAAAIQSAADFFMTLFTAAGSPLMLAQL
jgi:hypothetical protein